MVTITNWTGQKCIVNTIFAVECGGVIVGVGWLDRHRIDVSDAVAVGARRDVIAVAERHFAVSSAIKLSWAMHTIYRAKEALMISKLFLWYKWY